jgi:outer membrane lipoprotein SlyB
MNKMILALGAVSALSLGACSDNDYGYNRGPGYYSQAPSGSYDAYRHYRSGSHYRPRHLSRNDTIYRGSDGRYYCKRDDGTTGLIVGGLAGGVLGNLIAPGGSATIGTLLGAAGGAVLGQAIDKGDAECK